MATGIGPNFAGIGVHPADGRPCVKAYGLAQKTYHPGRILTPLKRTNPRKGIDEDPGWVANPRHRGARPDRGQVGDRHRPGTDGVETGIDPRKRVIVGQFDPRGTPYAKDMKAPKLNRIAPMSLELTGATGSGAADVVRLAARRLASA